MPTERGQGVLRQLRRAESRDDDGLPDAELLGRFLVRRDRDALAVLVRRHGPMVLGVCRRVLHREQDAEDAFQVTFLVLVRNAGSIRKRESLGHWLYGVALRTAREARAALVRRGTTERQVDAMPEPTAEPAEPSCDWRPILDAELGRLPRKYRAAIVLCDLEGRSRRDAARELAVAEGTLSSRLATARRMLAERLTRRGVVLSAAALPAALGGQSIAALPPALVQQTVDAAASAAAGEATAGVVSASVLVLTERVVRTMLMSKLKTAVAVLLVVGLIGAGVAAAGYRAWAGQKPDKKDAAPAAPAAQNEGGKLKALMKERRDLAASQFEAWKNGVERWTDAVELSRGRIGPGGTGDRLLMGDWDRTAATLARSWASAYEWADRLLKSELELADKDADRVAAHEAHLKRMKELEEFCKKRTKQGEPKEHAALAEFHRLDAEIMLERAKTK
jgi:RNA polymerase sigma factor (sigma-70 family)